MRESTIHTVSHLLERVQPAEAPGPCQDNGRTHPRSPFCG